MKRLGIVAAAVALLALLAPLTPQSGTLALGGGASPHASAARSASGVKRRGAAEASPLRKRRRVQRWSCAVVHNRTRDEYKCTLPGERKACRCAIARCKHWNPGSPSQCSSSCKCRKK